MIFLKEFRLNSEKSAGNINTLLSKLCEFFEIEETDTQKKIEKSLSKDLRENKLQTLGSVLYRFYIAKRKEECCLVVNREEREAQTSFAEKIGKLTGTYSAQGNYSPLKTKSFRIVLPPGSEDKSEDDLFHFISEQVESTDGKTTFYQTRNRELESALDELKDNQEALYKANLELKDLAIQLAAKNQELTDFSYIVSHDLKGPLNNMVNLIDLLHIKSQNPQVDLEPYLNAGRNEVAKMRLFIERVLDFCKAGEEVKAFKTIDLNEFFKQFFTDHRYSKAVSYELVGLKTLRYSTEELEMISNNLISNAVKYNVHDLVEIKIYQSSQNPRLLQFEDNGIGIAPEHRHHIFNFGSILSNKGDKISSGVGLALIKRLVEKYDGGKIWVDSKQQSGSVFNVLFGEK